MSKVWEGIMIDFLTNPFYMVASGVVLLIAGILLWRHNPSTNQQDMTRRLTSGRRFLTVCVGISFVMLVYAHVKKGPEYSISSEAITSIISGVIGFAWGKHSNKKLPEEQP